MPLYTFTSSFSRNVSYAVVGIVVTAFLLPLSASAQTNDQWYNKTEWTFSWGERALASAVAVDIASASGEEPFTVFKPPVESVTFDDEYLHEGLQYFVLQFKEDGEWGDIYEQELRIDATPPDLSVQIEYTEDGLPLLFIEAFDELSGIAKYTLIVESTGEKIELSPEEVVSGYILDGVTDSTSTVVVTAYDKAGNITALRSQVVMSTSVELGTIMKGVQTYLAEHPAEVYIVVIVFLSVMAVAGVAFGVTEHVLHRHARDAKRREILAMQNQTAKVFSALRKEVTMLTALTAKKSRVTKKEKEAIEKVTRALSASESVIEKQNRQV